jgi:hypothetical protein
LFGKKINTFFEIKFPCIIASSQLLAPALFQRGDEDGKLKGFEESDIIKEGRRVGLLVNLIKYISPFI